MKWVIQTKEVDSYEKHCELINAGDELQKYSNCEAWFYQHKDMPDMREMKPGRNLCTRSLRLKIELEELTAIEYREYLAKLLNDAASSKSVELLSTVTHTIFNTRTALYELVRLFSALSLCTLRKQKNINDRVIIAMTEKLTPVQLGSDKSVIDMTQHNKLAH